MQLNKDQGQKQLDAIKIQKENKPEIIEKGKIVYVEGKIDKLFEMYPKSFTSQDINSSKKLANNENNIT